MTTTERAATIRRELKAKGWTSRDVSVKARYFANGSSIDVTIKNADVPLATVKAIAEEHESIRRDQFGEILGGGNTYLHVGFSSEARNVLADRMIANVNEAVTKRTGVDDRTLIDIPNTTYRLGAGSNGYGYSLWNDAGHVHEFSDAREVAIYVAIRN
jgi:hypothetical protein